MLAPAHGQRAPALSQPAPALSQPAPALSEPTFALSQRAPALSLPTLAFSQLAPALSQPALALSQRAPALCQPTCFYMLTGQVHISVSDTDSLVLVCSAAASVSHLIQLSPAADTCCLLCYLAVQSVTCHLGRWAWLPVCSVNWLPVS